MPKKTFIGPTNGAGLQLNKFHFIWIIATAFLVAAVAWLGHQNSTLRATLADCTTPASRQAVESQENQAALTAVGQLMQLPSGSPTVATIVDSASLKSQQPFFSEASDGDKLLIYSDLAIIYRPSNNQIIKSGPVKVLPDTLSASSTLPTVEIRNGGANKGAAATLADKLTAAGQWRVATVGNTALDNYQGNTVVNVSGRDLPNLAALAADLTAAVTSSMPIGEATSSADAVVILGK